MKMADYGAKIKTRKSDKIAIDRYKIYRVTDPIQFAYLFFPAKNATHNPYHNRNQPQDHFESQNHSQNQTT